MQDSESYETRNVSDDVCLKAKRRKVVDVHDKVQKVPKFSLNRSKRCFDRRRVVKSCNARSSFVTLDRRTSPGPLSIAINSLSAEQKSLLFDIGFGSLIGFNIINLCPKLSFYVVDAFDGDDMVIRTTKGDISCDREAVFDVFGISKDATEPIKSGVMRTGTSFYKDWVSQFSVKDIRSSDISAVIVKSKGVVDRFFKMNFLMLFYNTMIRCDSNGVVFRDVLEYLDGDCQNASKIDWCGELLYVLEYSKIKWNRYYPKKRPYCGPLTFLTVSVCL